MTVDRKIEIVFVGKTAFPVSSASSNRILSLGKGLKNSGANVSVYCFGLPKFATKNNLIVKQGKIEGIRYKYTGIGDYSSSLKILRGLNLLIGQFVGYYLLFIRYKKKKPFFFTSQTGISYIFPLWLLTKLLKGKLFFFRSEYPKPVLNKSILLWVYEYFIYPVSIKMFDGMFIMTRSLEKYFNKWKNKNAFTDITPLTIDINLFKKSYSPIINSPYIAYSGSLSNKKDGVDILIRAFAKISSDYPELKLIIIGGGSGLEKLKELANSQIENKNKITFTGLIDYKNIPAYIKNAKILALARPNSVQAEGGFPSKLGEYLATGNPVVVTNTGEIGYYLKDKINVIIAEPGSIDDFANKLKWTLDNPSVAKQIGQKGIEVVEKNFDSTIIGEKILKRLYN